MRIRISRPALVAGIVAAILTCTGDLWSNTVLGNTLGDAFLAWGVILASIPFGGLHNNPPVYLVFALGALLNGLLWGGIASAAGSIIRRYRAQRAAQTLANGRRE